MQTSLSIRTENMIFELSMMRDLIRQEKETLIKKSQKVARNKEKRKNSIPLTEQIALEYYDNYLIGIFRKDYPMILEDL